MEKEQNEGQWFVIRHDKCGSILTINTDSVSKAFASSEDGDPPVLACPNCGEIATNYRELKDFFDAHRKLNKNLTNAGFTMKKKKEAY
ncbi:MAG: hypothetical protein R6V46_16695 [Desulfatiglandaceae bacterium]|jgi:hypothetical protein